MAIQSLRKAWIATLRSRLCQNPIFAIANVGEAIQKPCKFNVSLDCHVASLLAMTDGLCSGDYRPLLRNFLLIIFTLDIEQLRIFAAGGH